jgi:hypothetical protein
MYEAEILSFRLRRSVSVLRTSKTQPFGSSVLSHLLAIAFNQIDFLVSIAESYMVSLFVRQSVNARPDFRNVSCISWIYSSGSYQYVMK